MSEAAWQEAVKIVDGLMTQFERRPEPDPQIPFNWYQRLLASDDPLPLFRSIQGEIESDPAREGERAYLLAVLQTCAFCAHVANSPEHLAWPILSKAHRHAGAALALFVSTKESGHKKSVTGHKGKDAQIAQNDALRDRVLDEAARSKSNKLSEVASNIVDRLVRIHGSPEGVVDAFGAKVALGSEAEGVNAEGRTKQLARRFRDIIALDMKNRRVTNTDAKERLEQWKILYGSRATG